jgi:hypothetical protein
MEREGVEIVHKPVVPILIGRFVFELINSANTPN